MDYIDIIAQRHQQLITGSSVKQIQAVINDVVSVRLNTPIQILTDLLIELSGVYIYPEYYSHTNKLMWKINNPFTKNNMGVKVLLPVDEPIENSLKMALELLKKEKYIFLKDNS